MTKEWLSYLEDLCLDLDTENRFATQLRSIYRIKSDGKFDLFLETLTETINLQKALSVSSQELGDYNDFRIAKKMLLDEYVFHYDKKPKDYTPPKVATTLSDASNDLLVAGNTPEDKTKIKLANSSVSVYKRFYNTDTVEQNLSKCPKKLDSNSVAWRSLSKDLLCEVLMPILNSMLFFNESEFWEFKKIKTYNRYLTKETFESHFETWDEFERYLGVVKETPKNNSMKCNKVSIPINGSFIKKVTVAEIKQNHLNHETHWVTETKGLIGLAAIPVLTKLKGESLDDLTFIKKFNDVYNININDGLTIPVGSNWTDLANRSKFKQKDFIIKFGSWDLFLKFLEKGY